MRTLRVTGPGNSADFDSPGDSKKVRGRTEGGFAPRPTLRKICQAELRLLINRETCSKLNREERNESYRARSRRSFTVHAAEKAVAS